MCDGSWRRVGGGCCFRQFVSGLVAWYALMIWNPDEDGEAFPDVYSLANKLCAMCENMNSFKRRLAVRAN